MIILFKSFESYLIALQIMQCRKLDSFFFLIPIFLESYKSARFKPIITYHIMRKGII